MTENPPVNSENNAPITNAEADVHNMVTVPLVILPEHVVSPLAQTDIYIKSEQNIAVVEHTLKEQITFMVIQRLPDVDDDTGLLEQFAKTGTEVAPLNQGYDDLRRMITVAGRRRLQIAEIIQTEPFPIVKAWIRYDHVQDEERLFQRRNDLMSVFENLLDFDSGLDDDVIDYIYAIEDDAELVDMLWAVLDFSVADKQQLLDELAVDERMRLLVTLLEQQIDGAMVMEHVNDRVENELSQAHRSFILREQMRVIQAELDAIEDSTGNGSDKKPGSLRQRIEKIDFPPEAQSHAIHELARLQQMPAFSPEASVIRNYLEYVLDLPWGIQSKDKLNLRSAEKILNQAHFGLDKVKARILEHIAVRKLAGDNMQTPILCFVGPPGVGKTSIGRSIAKALGREFVRVSLGGVRDDAEIRGHRRTYVGAMPGRILQTLKRAGTNNPVFMLDEIDKLSTDYHGDPAAALLEVLDPEQNHEFLDHYLEVPYDLSDVFFITTANELYPLPEALEDRLEIIEFDPYTEEEKIEIATKYLIPRQLKAHGIGRRGIQFQNTTLEHIIRDYTLEAGVRNLEREIASVCRKITRRVAMQQKYPKRITTKLVNDYLGPPQVFHTRASTEDNIGLVTGLVWTGAGGDIQLIETLLLPGKGSLTLTGQLGDVLQESAQTAFTYMRSRADELDIPHDDFDNYDIHIHMPEGAVPKDGPSAGITLATAMISVFTERKIRSAIAMTGEMTLRGHVLPIGGVKEKVLSARRHRIKEVILPADNEKDLVDIPKQSLRDMTIHFVNDMQEVMDLVLLDAPEERQRDIDAAEHEQDDDSSEADE
ncbi:MAG: endopeptidase La [Aggregatilineales bacterium]